MTGLQAPGDRRQIIRSELGCVLSSESTDAFEAPLKREYLGPSGTQQTSQTDRPFHTPAHSLVGPA